MRSAIFERRFAKLIERIAAVERNEAALAERIRNAHGRSDSVTQSTGRLQDAFPDILIPDPIDGQWTLRPAAPNLHGQWEARRAVIVEREVPALNSAAQTAKTEAADAESRRDRLRSRLESARRPVRGAVRRQPPASSGNKSKRRWSVFHWFALPRPATRRPEEMTVGLDELTKRIDELASAGHKAADHQSEFGVCAAEIQRLRRRLETLDHRSPE